MADERPRPEPVKPAEPIFQCQTCKHQFIGVQCTYCGTLRGASDKPMERLA